MIFESPENHPVKHCELRMHQILECIFQYFFSKILATHRTHKNLPYFIEKRFKAQTSELKNSKISTPLNSKSPKLLNFKPPKNQLYKSGFKNMTK